MPRQQAGEALIRLPRVLAERFSVVGELPVQGAESDLLQVHDRHGVDYVVKLFRRGYGADREVWDKLPSLQSPHVVRILETGRADDRDYEITEYAPAGNLRALMPATGLAPGRVAEMTAQLAAGLARLHRAGIVHRDLKPENILVASKEPLRLVITDFGLSKVIEQSMVFASSSRTLAYAAPESLSGQVSPARDWWSLGMIVRELLTGRPPFLGMSETAVVDHLATRAIDNDDVADPRLRLLCQGLLTRDPRRRWSAAEVTAWLGGDSPPVAREGVRGHARAGADGGPGLPFAGRRFTDRGELARALVDNWDDAARYFFSRGAGGEAWRTLRDWLAQYDEDSRIELIDSQLAGSAPPDVKLLHLVRWLDQSLPPHYLGRRVLAEDLARLAALASETPHPDHRTACLIGRGLWEHDLLPVLAAFTGGAGLAEVGARWRGHVTAWNELTGRLRGQLPPPVASRLPDAGVPGRDEPPTVLLTLLALAAKPAETGEMLAWAAVRARDSVREPVPWFGWLADSAGDDPLRQLTVVRTAPDAVLDAEAVVRDRHTARQQAVDRERHWAERERRRIAGRGAAIARAVAWSLPLLALWLVGGWLVGAGISLERGSAAGYAADLGVGVFLALGVAAWLVQLTCEVMLATRQGADYLALGPWSGLAKTFGTASRGLSSASRAVSGARPGTARRRGSRGLGCLLAAGGLFVLLVLTVLLPALLSAARALWLLVIVAVPVGHTIFAGVRMHRWRQAHEQAQRAALEAG